MFFKRAVKHMEKENCAGVRGMIMHRIIISLVLIFLRGKNTFSDESCLSSSVVNATLVCCVQCN